MTRNEIPTGVPNIHVENPALVRADQPQSPEIILEAALADEPPLRIERVALTRLTDPSPLEDGREVTLRIEQEG